MKSERKGRQVSSRVRSNAWTGMGTLQAMPYRPYLGFKSRRPLRQRDRLPNFQDSELDFTRADGKEAVSGFPAGKSREEEDADFQQKINRRIRRNDWMTRRISDIGKELL